MEQDGIYYGNQVRRHHMVPVSSVSNYGNRVRRLVLLSHNYNVPIYITC